MTTDEILRGLRKLRGTSRTHASADILDAAIARIEADASELAKSDRRTAEQETVIAAQRVRIGELDGALTESLAGWQSLVEVTTQSASWEEDDDGRKIAKLRKLTRAPARASGAPTDHEDDCAVYLDEACNCPMGNM